MTEWSSFWPCTCEAGFDPQGAEMLGSVLVNHILLVPRYKNGSSECGEDRNQRVPTLRGMFGGATVPIHLMVMAYTKAG